MENFERVAQDNGIVVAKHQSANGAAFTSKAFKEELTRKGQTAQCSSAGSHHQNGKAERGIGTAMAMTRTMLLQFAIHWAKMADPSLWPMAVKHAAFQHNLIPNLSSGLSPLDLWFKTQFPMRKLHNLLVLGSPVCFLQRGVLKNKTHKFDELNLIIR